MTTIEKNIVRVGKYVDTKHVDTLVRTYKQERWVQNTERLGQEDSLNLYYTIEELQEFLEKAKQAGANGVRVHFGVYPEGFNERPEYAGKQTTVFVATQKQETESGRIEKNVYVDSNKGRTILAYNMGGLDPNDTGMDGVGITIVDRADKGLTVI